MPLVPESGRALRLSGKSRLALSETEEDDLARCQPKSAEARGRRSDVGAADDHPRGGKNRSPSPSPHGRTRMTVFPLRRSVGFKAATALSRSEEHTSELQSLRHLVCRLLLEKKKKSQDNIISRKITKCEAKDNNQGTIRGAMVTRRNILRTEMNSKLTMRATTEEPYTRLKGE